METSFEERLYNHYLYINHLFNIRLDIRSFIQDNFGNSIDIVLKEYKNGKIAELEIIKKEDIENDEIKNYIENLITIQESFYFQSVGYNYIEETNILQLWINI